MQYDVVELKRKSNRVKLIKNAQNDVINGRTKSTLTGKFKVFSLTLEVCHLFWILFE